MHHDLRGVGVAVHKGQRPPALVGTDIIRVREQGGSVVRVGPGGVGLGEGVGLPREGGGAAAVEEEEGPVVARAEGAVAHAELVVGVVPGRGGRGGEVELVPRPAGPGGAAAPAAAAGRARRPGGQGAVEGGGEGHGRCGARGDGDAAGGGGGGPAGGGGGEGAAG